MFSYKSLRLMAAFALMAIALSGQPSVSLGSIKKIYIEKMPNDLDQYLRAEISKQFKGRVTVVLEAFTITPPERSPCWIKKGRISSGSTKPAIAAWSSA
jgi:hypothetical protein